MRVLSIERIVRGLILLLAALATVKIRSSKGLLSAIIDQKLPLLKPFTKSLGWDIDRSWLIHTLRSIAGAKQHTLTLITLGLIGYACIQFAEAVGLWMMSRWGEYLVVVATSLFIPLEIYEVIKSITVLKVIALIINICLVLYLLYSKRLFNVRGGYKAFQKEHQAANLLNMKSIADSQESPK